MKSMFIALRFSIVLMLICGLVYPLVTTGFAQVLFPKQADGSLMTAADGTVTGSKLIAQNVESSMLFHPRASNAKYDPTASAGSNRAVATTDYVKEIGDKVAAVKADNPGLAKIPADLVTVSGSGFDPDLSPEAAKAQVARISKATGMSADALNKLIDDAEQGRQLSIFGEPRVNVNALNEALLKQIKP
ncbi:potassium-transporting ATPase subunit KdpC [Paenibacillus sacheonensis]|uniref:Potassium-transporting ATPase KdpC subunit n=1 Tax=Paenibacillus sacheonensis TaxID=742054 RepID=A0A7X5C190_9BACL|nr:potassium-transporting ATPase subunit KdpC [Paenibacillus sacheonensis]MBM7568672.1 K+-transporting ATPase ATPase C chain [Paenibacillus sacheonensis]NBC72436.1 potassium-transporting ATPase subunit KdpC [Paenibacillus sacheonensis]